MAHRKKGKTWKKGKVTDIKLPIRINVRCCCTPTKILGTIASDLIHLSKLRYFGEDNEVAVYGDGETLSFWEKHPGFIAV